MVYGSREPYRITPANRYSVHNNDYHGHPYLHTYALPLSEAIRSYCRCCVLWPTIAADWLAEFVAKTDTASRL